MRSGDQNNCFHKWCRRISEHIGNPEIPENLIKDLVKREFGPKLEITVGSLTKTVDKPTHLYTTPEMVDMLSQMEVWANTDLELDLNER